MTVSKNESETRKIASDLAQKLAPGTLVCLYGDLGTGKTVFTKGLAEGLKLDKFTVKSPTYTYIRKYQTEDQKIYHIDLYRLDSIDELLRQEIEEIIEQGDAIIIIEWAERMEKFLPENRINVRLSYLNENSRNIEISEND